MKIFLSGIVLVAVFLIGTSVYIVNQAEQAIVLQFGRPVRLVQEPGLKIKIPFIQNVIFYDTRLLNLDPPAQEVVLNDKKRLDVDSFTRYKIVDPIKFYKTVRTKFSDAAPYRNCCRKNVPKLCLISAPPLKLTLLKSVSA